jgi:cell division protein FtsB
MENDQPTDPPETSTQQRVDPPAQMSAGDKLEDAFRLDVDTSGFDTAHWARRAFWSVDECAALVLKRDPDKIRKFELDELIRTAPFGQDLADMRARIDAARKDGRLPLRIRPFEFLAWAREEGIQLRYALEKAIEACEVDLDALRDRHERLREENRHLRYEIDRLKGGTHRETEKEKASKDLTPRERSSILKMVIAMAMELYGHVPGKRGTTAKDIADEIDKRGMRLSEDTIRKFLQEAEEELP